MSSEKFPNRGADGGQSEFVTFVGNKRFGIEITRTKVSSVQDEAIYYGLLNGLGLSDDIKPAVKPFHYKYKFRIVRGSKI